MSKTSIVATGDKLVGQGIRSIYSVANEMINDSQEEILIVTFSFTQNIDYLLETLKAKVMKGIRTTIILNDFSEYDKKLINDLKLFANSYKHFQLINFAEKFISLLHMKILIVDRKKALIGSANFTWKGMIDNYEIGVYVEGELAENLYILILKMLN